MEFLPLKGFNVLSKSINVAEEPLMKHMSGFTKLFFAQATCDLLYKIISAWPSLTFFFGFDGLVWIQDVWISNHGIWISN